MDLKAWGREAGWAFTVSKNIHCGSKAPGREDTPCPTSVRPYPSLTAESHPQVPVVLNSRTMTWWAALALLSLFTYPWELALGLTPLPSAENTVFFDWRAKLLSESVGSRAEAFS